MQRLEVLGPGKSEHVEKGQAASRKAPKGCTGRQAVMDKGVDKGVDKRVDKGVDNRVVKGVDTGWSRA